MKKFQIISEVIGYNSKAEPTNLDERFLVSGSQNVIIDDARKVKTRGGYTIYGVSSSATTGVNGSYDWENSSGDVYHFKAYANTTLQVYIGTVDSIAFNAWTTLKSDFTATDFCFVPWWDTA